MIQEPERFEIPQSAKQILDAMKKAGYVWVKEDELKPIKLRDKILRKKWITQKEIADSNIWNVKSKGGVERIVKQEIDPDLMDKENTPYKIHRSEVERIALNRGTI